MTAWLRSSADMTRRDAARLARHATRLRTYGRHWTTHPPGATPPLL